MTNKLIIIGGATATGKTALAVQIAKKLNTEIISADSMLVYKRLDIGTAKPTEIEKEGVKHHLIDIISPSENFSVNDYSILANKEIKKLQEEDRIPVVCGGTGFYINSILYDLSYGNISSDESIRKKYEDFCSREGNENLFKILQEKDFETSLKLHPNDTKRVIRALEIIDVTGKKKSEIVDEKKSKHKFVAVGIDYDRNILYKRINARVDRMMELGLVDEVKSLLNDGLTLENQSMQGIGYKEVVEFLNNQYNHSTMSDIIKQNTRNYAKRQITFFKKVENFEFLELKDFNHLVDEVIKKLYNGDNDK